MKPEYPIFIVDEDDTITIYNSITELSYFEQIDVESVGYSGWDVKGYPLILVNGEERYEIEPIITSDQPNVEELKRSIIADGKRSTNNYDDNKDLYDIDQDVIELYNIVRKHIHQVHEKEASERNLIRRMKDIYARLISDKHK